MLMYFLQYSYYGAPRQSSLPRHFSYPLQLLLGGLLIEAEAGLLIEAEAGHLTLRPRPTSQQWERCSRWPKSWGDNHCDRLSRFGSLFLHLLVKQFDNPPGRLVESGRSLWRVTWTVLANTLWAWAGFMTLSHSPLRRQYQRLTPSQWDFSDPSPPSPVLLLLLLIIAYSCNLVKALSW
jgi:hypothetical protein